MGRNMDRGDAKKLPPDQLDLCEIEPLRQEETGSDRWDLHQTFRDVSSLSTLHPRQVMLCTWTGVAQRVYSQVDWVILVNLCIFKY